MPGTTPTYGFPFPTGTDRVMDGDNAIAALAEAVEDQLLRFVPMASVTVLTATTAAMVPIADTPVIPGIPANAVLASGYITLSGDAIHPNNVMIVMHGSNDAFAAQAWSNGSIGYKAGAPFIAQIKQSGGARLRYRVDRVNGNLTYTLNVSGYWAIA